MSMALSWKLFFAVGLMLVDLGYSSNKTSRQSLEFWRNTDTFCGTASICREEFSTERISGEENIGNGKGSCCRDCSCSINCGWQSNCCFESDENAILIDRSEQECLFPTTDQPEGTIKYNYVSYYMFIKYPGNASSKTGNDRTCGDAVVSSLKDLPPVFSKKTRRIYKNIDCAKQFGIDDGILWDTLIICKNKYHLENRTVSYRTLEEIIYDLERYGKAPGCEFNFIYPEEMSDLNSEQCFQDLVEACTENDFEIPDGMNLTSNKVKDACESGLFSPYVLSQQEAPRGLKYGNYKNVYCSICNGLNYDALETHVCSDPTQNGLKLLSEYSFAVLLNNAFTDKENTGGYVEACEISNGKMDTDKCRNVFCPTAQYRNKDGSCTLAVSQWIATDFLAILKLTLKHRLKIKDVLGMQISDVLHPIKTRWRIIFINTYYTCDDGLVEEEYITSLFITIGNVVRMSKAGTILSDMATLTSEKWHIRVNGSLIQASVNFSSNFLRCESYDTYCQNQFQKRNMSQLCSETLAFTLSMTFKTVVQGIDKLFYCEHVTLHTGEFELFAGKQLLIDKMTGKLFFSKEFAVVAGTDGVESVRICVEDSVFKRIDRSLATSSTYSSRHILWIVIYLFLNF